MKKLLLFAALSLALVGCSTKPDRPNPAKNFIKAVDRNESNEASWEECNQYYAELFIRLDVNKDGQISQDEFKAFGEQPLKAERLPKLDMTLAMFDKDKDGSLSRDEFLRMGDRVFSLMDKNSDGLVTEDDFIMPKPGGGPMGRGGMDMGRGGGMDRGGMGGPGGGMPGW